ncbi:M20 family metallopeptidase [Plantactinospora soyae]|uniref:Glutamate carboxypeptidase n=1 Tax=Plantactinospora soyae TaxID=1544732 RepID=A0A927MDJ8_9ACTN|nr:M20 family metallopeptidase [Plantactinospora soyae]MBE1491690.1 glutamate carboxypeptidase [Plantactinospora soyae]
MADDALLERFRAALPAMLADIEALVTCESPSVDHTALAASADAVTRIGIRLLGVAPERIVLDGCPHLRWRFGDGPARVLLLGHHDTVWPLGTLATHPFDVTDGVLRGPGCVDMVAGLVLGLYAVAALTDRSGVTILVTGDEELGSPSSRTLVEAEAAGCAGALVLEAAADGGALKTERKGVSRYRVEVTGLAAHAGLEPERGVNATVELAHQVLAVNALGDPDRGTTVTPTLVAAGTSTNTVPDAGGFAVDVRARNAAEQHRVDAAMRALTPVLPGARLTVTGGPNRPPLAAGASTELFAIAEVLAARLGLPPLRGAAVGGGSDGNFTAGVGTPTLDGLGAVGGGAHADHEHVLVAELPGRAALVAALTEHLRGRGGERPGDGDRPTPTEPPAGSGLRRA